MIEFEWVEAKRIKTLKERGVDFVSARDFFDGRPIVHRPSPRHGEARWKSTGLLGEKLYTIVWMWRDGKIRIISMRRSDAKEERTYRQLYAS
jgi:uncharacterized protein